MDKKTAEQLINEIISINQCLNRMTGVSIDVLSADEAVAFRKVLAKVMISNSDLLRYVVHQHPDLDPDK